MRSFIRSHALTLLLPFVMAQAFAAPSPPADAPIILHDFGLGSQIEGSNLYASLILDAAGNLYGTAENGGAYGRGVVFRLTPASSGPWTETVLHSFKGGASDGSVPHASVVFDSAGNLYGTTTEGGGGQCPAGCGIVFELTPTASGAWDETVIHAFSGGADGASPFSSVVPDPLGRLYGATTSGGANGLGLVYRLASSSGVWSETVLHTFTGAPDGASAWAAPIFDNAGHLYGTTNRGGAAGKGTIYELVPQSGGGYTAHVLHSFHGAADGSDLFETLTMDARGNLYGSAETGGSAGCGVAFELVRNSPVSWTFNILHTFLGILSQDGENPNSLIFDPSGNLWGTTVGGGVDNPGTIFEMTNSSGAWTETVLYSFTGGYDGAYPSVGLVRDSSGNLYGTTLWGGPSGDTTGGVAFEFKP